MLKSCRHMPTRHAFIAPLVATLVVLSVLINSGTTKRVATGTVAVFREGESISVSGDGMDRSQSPCEKRRSMRVIPPLLGRAFA